MNKLKQNIAYKGLLTFATYIIGFVTFPYVTRMLGPEKWGAVNFVLNSVDYFLLFATMGITFLGTREIAACKNDRIQLNQTFSNLFFLNLIFSVIVLALYVGSIFLIPKFYDNEELFLIGGAKIFFTAFCIEWLFAGLENFKYITYRTLATRIIYVALVFIFVRNEADYKIYFILTIVITIVNALINFSYSRKWVSLVRPNGWRCYLKQNFKLGIYTIMTSMYITFNVMYLGLVNTDEQVGYYSTAVKLYFIAVSLFGAFTSVMMPRMSSILGDQNKELFQIYIYKGLKICILIAMPIIIYGECFAPEIIRLVSGEGYGSSVIPMRILMPAIIMVWTAQVLVLQGLMPLKKDNVMLATSVIGAGLAIILNIFFTSKLGAMGSSIVLLGCETITLLSYLIVIKKHQYFSLPDFNWWLKSLLNALPYILICIVSIRLIPEGFIAFAVAVAMGVIYFFSLRPLALIRKS